MGGRFITCVYVLREKNTENYIIHYNSSNQVPAEIKQRPRKLSTSHHPKTWATAQAVQAAVRNYTLAPELEIVRLFCVERQETLLSKDRYPSYSELIADS